MIQYIKYIWAHIFKKSSIVGLELEYAEDILEERNIIYRVVMIDNVPFMLTADYKPERLNLYIEDGKVVKITNG